MFLGERNLAAHGAILTDVINYNNYHNRNHHNYNGTGNDAGGIIAANDPLTPPEHFPITDQSLMASRAAGADTGNVSAWLEVYDYAGGTSFRAFVSEDTEIKSLFVFFDAGVLGRDLKQALVALIELAEGPLDCSHMVICLDRSFPDEELKAMMKGLQWAGFSLTTLDHWTGGMDVISNQWLFMGMEV